MDMEPIAGIGSNNPPVPIDQFEEIKSRVAEIEDAANVWIKDVPEILDPDTAATCDSFLSQVKDAADKADALRKEINKPHDDAIKANNERFKPLTATLATIKSLLTPKKTAWLTREAQRIEAERRAAEEAARKALEEAEQAAAAAEKATTVAEAVEAEEKVKAAEEALTLSQRLAKLKPTVRGDLSKRASGLRSFWSARITDWPKAIEHYGDHPKVRDLIQQLANEDARKHKADLSVPGVQPVEERRAA